MKGCSPRSRAGLLIAIVVLALAAPGSPAAARTIAADGATTTPTATISATPNPTPDGTVTIAWQSTYAGDSLYPGCSPCHEVVAFKDGVEWDQANDLCIPLRPCAPPYSVFGRGASGSRTIGGLEAGSVYTFKLYIDANPKPVVYEVTVTVTAVAVAAWTVMFYIAADNADVAQWQQDSLKALRAALASSSPSGINVVYFFDGPGDNDTKYGVLAPGSQRVMQQTELDSGRPETLRDFVQWAKQAYPAQHYALTIDDHGSLPGVAIDEHSPADSREPAFVQQVGHDLLTHKNIRAALEAAGAVDILNMEACLQAFLEAAYELRGVARYYVASEDTQFTAPDQTSAKGTRRYEWFIQGHANLTSPIPALTAATTPEDFAKAMARTQALRLRPAVQLNKPYTVSVLDLAAAKPVVDATHALAARLLMVHNIGNTLKPILNDVQRFDTSGDCSLSTQDILIDLDHFAQLVGDQIADAEAQQSAADLRTAISAMVAYEDHSVPLIPAPCQGGFRGPQNSLSHSRGVAIVAPMSKQSWYNGGLYEFATGTTWVGALATTAAAAGTAPAWGALLVDYIAATNPDTPDTPVPPLPLPPLDPAAEPPPQRYVLTLHSDLPGTVTATPATNPYPAGSTLTLTAQDPPGQTFAGWTIDGAPTGIASSLTLVMDADHTVEATFVPRPSFGDVATTDPAADAIAHLAARGVINGCDKDAKPLPLFCPDAPTLRHQMAALIARAMPGWTDETGLPTFTDNTEDTELMTRVATLQRHNVVRGYQDDVCREQGKQPPCYGPLDTVKYGQVMLFVARAMVAHGYWQLQGDDRSIFPDQNGAPGADPATDQQTLDHRAVVTYVHYAGTPPDVSSAAAPFAVATPQGVKGWADPAPRAWFARAFWQALDSSFGR